MSSEVTWFRSRRNVLPHLSCHTVPPLQFIGKNGFRIQRRQDQQLRENASAARNLILASTPQPSRTSIVMARLTTSGKAKSLSMRASWAMKGSPWLFRKMTLPPGKYLSDVTARTQDLGVAIPVKPVQVCPDVHERKRPMPSKRESVSMVAREKRIQGAFGAFALCPETNVPSLPRW